MRRMTDTNFRSLFDLPRDMAYLNAAYIGPIPKASAAAGQTAYDRRQRPWELVIQDEFFDRPEALRGEAAKLFGASANDMALMPSASYGLATAALNLPIKPGQEILTLAEQFPSNVYIWQRKAAESGASVRAATRSDNQSWTESVLATIGPQTAIVAIPGLHWADGGLIDLKAVSQTAKAHGAALVLDLTQSIATGPINIAEIDPDFAIASGYKWLMSPYSVAYCYISPKHHDGRPLEEGWIVRDGSEDFSRLVDYRDGYVDGGRRFDMGERGAMHTIPAALASQRWLNGFEADWLSAQLFARTEILADSVRSLGVICNTPDRAPHYLCLALPDHAPKDMAARLALRGVSVSQRGDNLRVTPHLYNDEIDLARFAEAIRAELS